MRRARVSCLIWCVCLVAAYIYSGSYFWAGAAAGTFAAAALSAVSLLFVGEKLEIEIRLPETVQKTDTFRGRASFQNHSFLPVFYGVCYLGWKNTLTLEQGEIQLPFAVGGKKTEEIVFEGCSRYAGECRFYVKKWNCFDYLRIFCRKRRPEKQADILVIPETVKIDTGLLTKEAYDMESYRYSAQRSGDDPSETFDIREYRMGDSIRQIHWKLTEKLDNVVVKERSYPVYNSVLILPELFFKGEQQAERRQALAEIFASLAISFLNKRTAFETGFYDGRTGKFYLERIESEEDFWNVVFLLLRTAEYEKAPNTIREYLEAYGERSFAHYIYITAEEESEEEELLKEYGELTVLRCSDACELGKEEIRFTMKNWKSELSEQDIRG